MELIDTLYDLLKKVSKRQWVLASILPTALILIAHFHEYKDARVFMSEQDDATSSASIDFRTIRSFVHSKSLSFQRQRMLEAGDDAFEGDNGDDQNDNDDGANDDANDQNDAAQDDALNEDDDDYFDNNEDENGGNSDEQGDDAQGSHDNNSNLYGDDEPVYIDDDYIDDYYAFKEDTKPKLDFFPITGRQALGLLFISMGVIISSGGGIGGGGIILPIYILALGIEPIDAIPLTAVTVCGGAFGSTLLNTGKRHPLADRTIIDWDVVLVMQPLILSGSFIGTLMHKALSDKFLVVLLVVFLSIAANYNLAVAKRMHKAEQAYLEKIRIAKSDVGLEQCQSAIDPFHAPTGSLDEDNIKNTLFRVPSNASSTSTPILPFTKSPKKSKAKGSSPKRSPSRLPSTEKAEILIRNPDFVSLRTDLSEEIKSTPRNKVIAVISMFIIVMFTNVMVGGGAFESPWAIRCGSFSYWIVHVCLVAFLIACTWAAQTYLTHRHEIRELVGGFEYIQGDIRWDTHNSLFYAFIFGSAGVMAGMFGIGGGIVTTPVMLAAMHVHPEVAAATSSCMVLFTSSLSFASYSLFGMIHWDYSAAVFIIGFCSCIFGNRIMRSARRKTKVHGRTFKRNSLLAYSVGGVLLLSAFLMSVQYIFVVIRYDDGENFGDICTPQISG